MQWRSKCVDFVSWLISHIWLNMHQSMQHHGHGRSATTYNTNIHQTYVTNQNKTLMILLCYQYQANWCLTSTYVHSRINNSRLQDVSASYNISLYQLHTKLYIQNKANTISLESVDGNVPSLALGRSITMSVFSYTKQSTLCLSHFHTTIWIFVYSLYFTLSIEEVLVKINVSSLPPVM